MEVNHAKQKAELTLNSAYKMCLWVEDWYFVVNIICSFSFCFVFFIEANLCSVA